MAAIRKTGAKLRKYILANDDIEVVVRAGVLHTHVFPVGGFASGTWSQLSSAESATHHRAIMDSYRVVDGSSRMDPGAAGELGVNIKTDRKVMKDMQVMSPHFRIVFAKIKLLTQILQRRLTGLLTLLYEGRTAQRSWITIVLADLSWQQGRSLSFRSCSRQKTTSG